MKCHSQYVCSNMLTDIIIHKTYYEISDWLRPSSQYTRACEVDMINQYLLLILGYYVVFKVLLVSKPLVYEVF